ncbi:thioesterase family protein [Alphaproteobacteria bacterium]|nr:thioesterase family protein [Alphaproteobacteria bacterium]
MSTYTQLLEAFYGSAPDYNVELPGNWLQGRTAFGGITSALLLAAIQHTHADLPPLRTMQVNFIGPAAGPLSVRQNLLRRGKNNVTVEARLDSELGAGTHGYFTFGVKREMSRTMDYPLHQPAIRPEQAELVIPRAPAPSFLSNFERRRISGPNLMDGSDHPDMLLWTRHTDAGARQGLIPLLVLGDAPPAALAGLTSVQALSSMNWNINMLSDDVSTQDGWWLVRSATRFIRDGYSSQLIQIWNSEGRRVMDSMQHLAVFA